MENIIAPTECNKMLAAFEKGQPKARTFNGILQPEVRRADFIIAFWVFSLTFFLGYNLRNATAYTKIFNLKSNLIATACFAIGNNIDYSIAFCMALGQLMGGRLGAHLAIKKGVTFIRTIFMMVVSLTMISLGYETYLK